MAVKESVVLVSRSEMTLPAPPREVCRAGRRVLGTDGCGSTTKYAAERADICVRVDDSCDSGYVVLLCRAARRDVFKIRFNVQ